MIITSSDMLKAQVNKAGFNIMIVLFYICWKRYMIFQYGREPVLIQRTLIGFQAILEKYFCIWERRNLWMLLFLFCLQVDFQLGDQDFLTILMWRKPHLFKVTGIYVFD